MNKSQSRLPRAIRTIGIALAVIVFAVPTLRSDDRSAVLKAYPDKISPDLTFETVVSSQPFPPVKYPVPILGWKHHPEEIHVAPNGALVFPWKGKPGGIYILPLVQAGTAGPGKLLDPDAVAQELVDGYKPGVKSVWSMKPLKISQIAFATLLEGLKVRTGKETLVAIARWTVKNESGREEAVRLVFKIGEAVSGLSLFKTPPSFPATLSFKPPFLRRADGKIMLKVAALGGTISFNAATGDGGRANELAVDLKLNPGQEKKIDVFIPYFPANIEKEGDLERMAVEPQLDLFKDYWEHELNRTAAFIVPEKRLRDSYRACLAYNFILVDLDEQGLLRPHPDATGYEYVWAGDSGCIIHATDRLGYHAEAAGYLAGFLATQGARKPEGDVSSAAGFFSGDVPGLAWMGDNGFILWALAEHYKLTGDKEWLKHAAHQMIASADWIIRERHKTMTPAAGERPRFYGLLPKGRASDNPELNYFYWTDTYSYAGLRGAADVLSDAGLAKEAQRLSAEADDYRACIRDSVERSVVRTTDPPFVPQGPLMNVPPTAERLGETWYSICSPIYMVEMGLLAPDDPKASWIDQTIEKYVMTTGLPTLTPGYIDPHYVYNQALAQLLRGETEKFLWTFYSLFAYGQSRTTYATIEGNDLVSGSSGDSWNSLRMPHMHSNSRVLAMLRIALLVEDGETLHLLAGTPRSWLEDGKVIQVRTAPTTFGDVSLRAESRLSSNSIIISIDPPTRRAARILLHVRPPSKFGAPKSVLVNGKPWIKVNGDIVDLGKVTGKTLVNCLY